MACVDLPLGLSDLRLIILPLPQLLQEFHAVYTLKLSAKQKI